MAGPVGEILLGAFRYGTQLLGESLGYLGRTGQDLVSGVRLIRLRQARTHSPERAAEYDPQIELLREQQAARWAQWRTLPDGRRWAIRSVSLLLTVGTVWASPYLVPGLGGTSRALSQDVLILRSDETRSGELKTCVGKICTLDSTSVPRDTIAWIGLRGAEPDPPSVNDPAQDEVHLKDSSVHAGQLAFVDRGRVVTERDSYQRDKVAWVYLAPPKADEQDRPDQFGAPGDEPPPSGPAVQRLDPPAEPPSSDHPTAGKRRPPRPPGDLVKPCPEDKPLGGWITMRYGFDPGRRPPSCKGTLDIRLRFPLAPEYGDLAEEHRTSVATLYKAGEVVYEIATDGCHDIVDGPLDYRDGNVACNAPGDRKSGTVALGPNSLQFFALSPSIHLNMPESVPLTLPGVCVHGDGYTSEYEVLFLGSEKLNIDSGAHCETSEQHKAGSGPFLLHFCVAPTVCHRHDARTADLTDCYRHPERYAVIPFSGSLTKRGAVYEWDGLPIQYDDIHVRWEICCGCGERRPGPPPERETSPPPDRRAPKKDSCGDWKGPRAQLDLALDQQKALMDQLAKRYDRYRAILDQAQNYQSDFKLVSRNCKLWEAARTLMSFLISNFAPRVPGRLPGQPAFEPAKEFANFISFLEKVLANDASWILPNHEFKDWVSLEDLWDGYKTAYDYVQSSPNKLLAGLQQCTDPITHDAIYQDALKYVRLLQEIEPLMEQVQRTLNDLRQKDLDLLDKWNKAHQACLEYQECRGGSAADCDQLQSGTKP